MKGCCFGFVLEDVVLGRSIDTQPPTMISLDNKELQNHMNTLFNDHDYITNIKPVTKIIKVKVNIPELLPLEAGGKIIEKNITTKSNFFKNTNAPVPNSKIKLGNYFTISVIPTLNLLSITKIAKGSKILIMMPTDNPQDFYGMVI